MRRSTWPIALGAILLLPTCESAGEAPSSAPPQSSTKQHKPERPPNAVPALRVAQLDDDGHKKARERLGLELKAPHEKWASDVPGLTATESMAANCLAYQRVAGFPADTATRRVVRKFHLPAPQVETAYSALIDEVGDVPGLLPKESDPEDIWCSGR